MQKNDRFHMIEELLGVFHVAVFEWMKAEADKPPKAEVPADFKLVNLDEMWRFLKTE